MKRLFLLGCVLLICRFGIAQSGFPPNEKAPKSFDLLQVGKLFWLSMRDTIGLSASTYPGAIVFRQQPGDTCHYKSNGVKWEKLGAVPDLTIYLRESDSAKYIQNNPSGKQTGNINISGTVVSGAVTVTGGGGVIAGASTFTAPVTGAIAVSGNQYPIRSQITDSLNERAGNYIGNQNIAAQSANFKINGTGEADTLKGASGLGVGSDWRMINSSGSWQLKHNPTGNIPLSTFGSSGIGVDGGIILDNGNFSMGMGGIGSPRYVELTNFNNANQFGIPSRSKFLMYDTVSSRVKLIPILDIVDAESGLEYTNGKFRLGTNPLLANTTIPLTGYSLNLTGDGTSTSTESNPFYLFNITDNRTGPTSVAVRNNQALGVATFALFNDKSAGVIGINGSAIPPSVDNGGMLPNHFYFDAGLQTRGIINQIASTDSSNYILKSHTDTLIRSSTSFNTYYQPVSIGGLFNLPQNRAADYLSPYMLETIGTDGTKGQFAITQYSNDEGGMSFHTRKSRGTQLNPLAILKGDRIHSMGSRGYDGEKFAGSSVAILAEAMEDFTPTANGTMLKFEVTPLGHYDGGRVLGLYLMPDGKARMNGRISLEDRLFGGISATAFMEFRDKDSLRTGYMGDASASNKNIYLVSDDEDVIIKSGAAAQVTVSDAGTTLNSNGSFAAGYREIGTSTTLTKTDYTALITSSSAVITIPAASTCPNRMYRLVNYGTGGGITISTVYRDAGSTTTLPNNAKWLIQSDGSNWLVIAD